MTKKFIKQFFFSVIAKKGSLKNPVFRVEGHEKPIYRGGGGLGQFAEGVWWKRGGSVSDGGWHTNAHYVCWKLR